MATILFGALVEPDQSHCLRGSVHVRGAQGHLGFAEHTFQPSARNSPRELTSSTAWALMAEAPGLVHVDVVRGWARGNKEERAIRPTGTQSALIARDTTDVLAFPVLDLRGGLRGMVCLELRLGSRERERRLPELMAKTQAMAELVEAATPWILGAAPDDVERMARKIATYEHVTVLLLGEMGTGKTRLARLIHQWSPRAERPLVEINLAGMHPDMVGAALFGTLPGAYTGAVARKGLLDAAQGGTLFLDEIGKLDLRVQTALLDVLERRGYRPLGDSGGKTLHPDVRLVLATNADLPAMVRVGRLLPDLYQRANVFPIEVPPLRHRSTSIPTLAGRKLAELAQDLNVSSLELSPEAAEVLLQQSWPGNIRQLEVILLRAAIEAIGADRARVQARDVEWALARDRDRSARDGVLEVLGDAARLYARELRHRERAGLSPIGLEPLSAVRGLVLAELEHSLREEGMNEVDARRRAFLTLGEESVVRHANEGREWKKEQQRVQQLRELLGEASRSVK